MTIETTCPRCGEAFEPRRSGGKPQKYCSLKCSKAAAGAAFRDRNRPERVPRCAECGGPVAHVELGRPRRFCSDECRHRASNIRYRRALPPLRNPNPDQRICPQCGDAFTPKRRDRVYCYNKFCAQAAYKERRKAGATERVANRTTVCDGCGTEFETVRPEARWCSKECANRHWGNVRARQRGQLSEARYTDLEIFERDKWICHLCKKKVRRDVPRTDPEGATIDHLVPISLGGLDEPANVACSHWKCNRDKRARAMNEQLRLL